MPTDPEAFGDFWGDGGGYWGGGRHGAYGFSTMETPNSTVSDRVHSCKTRDPGDPPCIKVGHNVNKLILARSHHVMGVNVAFADGSTRFVSNAIAPLAWKAPGTRAGEGEELNLE